MSVCLIYVIFAVDMCVWLSFYSHTFTWIFNALQSGVAIKKTLQSFSISFKPFNCLFYLFDFFKWHFKRLRGFFFPSSPPDTLVRSSWKGVLDDPFVCANNHRFKAFISHSITSIIIIILCVCVFVFVEKPLVEISSSLSWWKWK